MESRDTLPRLRGSLDTNDGFVNRGHGVIHTAGYRSHAERMKRVPGWALDDLKIKELVHRCHPNPRYRKLAARMVRIIYLYYRVGYTAAAVAAELKMSKYKVKEIIYKLNKLVNGPVPRKGRKRKGISLPATSELVNEGIVVVDSKGFNAG
jgi:hypothetical protein